MAKLPSITRFIIEDVPEEHRDWVNKLYVSLNQFVSQTLDAFDNGLTFQENMDAFIHTIEFPGRDLSVATGDPLVIANRLKGVPVGCIKLKLEDITADGATAIDYAADVDWYYDQNGKIKITNISGIDETGAIKYRLTVLIF